MSKSPWRRRFLAGLVAVTALAGLGLPRLLPWRAGSTATATTLRPRAISDTGRAFLPLVWQGSTPFSPAYRHQALAEKSAAALAAYLARHPITVTFVAAWSDSPSAEAVRAHIDTACHDFPDLPDPFGPGAHRHACEEWVAGYLALATAGQVWRQREQPQGAPVTVTAWAGLYLDAEMDRLAAFVHGPEAAPGGVSYRDTKAAVWQNGLRAVNLAVSAELLRQADALGAERQARAEELLSGVARQWYAAWWQSGVQPSHGVTLTTLAAAASPARSLSGQPVAVSAPFTFTWDADAGNTPAEETAWLGAGAMLAARVLGERLPEASDIYAAGRHYIDYSITLNRPDPGRGDPVRSLNDARRGKPPGRRFLWLQNHGAGMPSVPYLGSTWHFVGMALLASDQAGATMWPSFAPDTAYWEFLKQSVGDSLRAPDGPGGAEGTFLLQLDPRGGIDYNLDAYPDWVSPCAAGIGGRQYVRYDGRAGPGPKYLSEVGIPVGVDFVTSGWPLVKIAADRGDTWYRSVWVSRLGAIFDSYTAQPPDPAWIACATAPWVSRNKAYQWSRIAAALTLAAVQADGFTVRPWPSAEPRPETTP